MASETIFYKSLALSVDRCSKTLYSVYFNPQFCEAEQVAMNCELREALEAAVADSNGAISFEARDLDCGVLVVRYNPMIEIGDYRLEELFAKLSRIITKHMVSYMRF